MNRAFIAKPKLVKEKLQQLELYKSDEWEPVYIDSQIGTKWVGYRLDDNPVDEPPNMLRLESLPAHVVCERAACTDFDDEAAAAGHYIRWSIPSDAAFEGHISALELAVSESSSEQTYRNVLISLAWSGLNESFNFRPVAGKSMPKIEEDYQYYKDLSKRAEVLIAKAISQLGYKIKRDPGIFKDC